MKIFMETYGCSANMADSETMKGLLAEAGHEYVDSVEEADFIIQNTCTVKGPTESKFFTKLKKLEESGKKILVTGCIAQSDPQKLKKHSILGIDNVHKVVEAVEATQKDELFRSIEKKPNNPRINLPKVRTNPHVEIVPILKGCLGSCTFCKTKQARGNLFSFMPGAIVREIKAAVKEGVKEIWLTSQDNGAYGFDMNYNLAKLLNDICAIEGEFMVRVGMGNPDLIVQFTDELIEAFRHPKVYKFLHLPVQCGSDKVLLDMKRMYSAQSFVNIVKKFRKEIPGFTLATDIIVAYPTESDDDFNETLRVMEDAHIDVLNISRFWPRPRTPAARLKPLDGATSKARAKQVVDLFEKNALIENKKWIGWEGEVLITEKGKHDTFTGRNFAYKPIIVPAPQDGTDLRGTRVTVAIKDATKHDFRAEIIEGSKATYSKIINTEETGLPT